MKTASANLLAHLAGETLTVCTLWKITRTDAQVFGFTDNSRDVTYSGVTYLAATGYTPSAIKTTADLSVDNLDVHSMLDSSTITEADIAAGLWDFAEVELMVVNYADLTQGHMLLRKGWLGNIKTGRVQGLLEGKSIAPQRTTMMKVATVSTLWDYINRAMPWNAPKSLSADEVFAVTAYLLNLASVVPADFTLSDKNIAEVQQRMPNRNGMTFYEPLWRVDGKGDTKNVACMKNCAVTETIHSSLPAFARDAHGNIAEQNRIIGPVRGADTTQPPPKGPVGSVSLPKPTVVAAATGGAAGVKSLLGANACLACHGMKSKIVGPGFNEVVAKHKGRADVESYLVSKIKGGGVGVYGSVPMPAQPQLSDADAKAIAQWIASGAP